MSARTKARKRALDVLFEADQRGESIGEVLTSRIRQPGTQAPLPEYTLVIVRGVIEHLERIDEIISTYSVGWALDRMPAVDRAALRLAVWEIVWADEVDAAVTASEVTGLVAELSTDDSPSFVSGMLSRVIELRDTLD